MSIFERAWHRFALIAHDMSSFLSFILSLQNRLCILIYLDIVKNASENEKFNLAEEISQLGAEFQVPQSTQENKASETATLATSSAASGSATSAASGSQAALSAPASPCTNSSPKGKPLLPSDFVFGPTVNSSNRYSCLIRNLFSRILRFLSLFLLRVLAKPLITSPTWCFWLQKALVFKPRPSLPLIKITVPRKRG